MWLIVLLRALTIAVNLPLDLVLIPRYGVYGAMWAIGIAHITSTIRNYCVIKYILYRPLQVPWMYIGRCFLATTPFLPLLVFINQIESIYSLIAVALPMIPLYVLGVRMAKLVGPEEANLISRSGLVGRQFILALLKA